LILQLSLRLGPAIPTLHPSLSNVTGVTAFQEQLTTCCLAPTPLGIGKPGDIAGLVAFLAGEEGRWITNEKIRRYGDIR
jgi:NAD(P)-dependent dehydrogenase (short-subunit alcohol dehydrogenase family)